MKCKSVVTNMTHSYNTSENKDLTSVALHQEKLVCVVVSLGLNHDDQALNFALEGARQFSSGKGHSMRKM